MVVLDKITSFVLILGQNRTCFLKLQVWIYFIPLICAGNDTHVDDFIA